MKRVKKMIRVMTGVVTPYLKRVGINSSRLLNTLLFGDVDQTFSSRNYNWYVYDRYNIVWFIDFVFGKGHCMRSWDYEVRRKHLK